MSAVVKLPDTNVLIRYLRNDVPAQFAIARDLFARVQQDKEKMYIAEGVLIEAAYVLEKTYGVPRQKVAEQLEAILFYKGVVNKNKAAVSWALRRHAETKKLDLVDCLLVAQAFARDNVELVTFDDRARKLAEHPDSKTYWRMARILDYSSGQRRQRK